MNRMQEYLLRAAEILSLKITIDPSFRLSNGKVLFFDALLHNLSNQNGILILNSDHNIQLESDVRQELSRSGFGVSEFGGPTKNEMFDIDSYIEMFSEWGWSGETEKRPAWMLDEN
jgi:hypothetical protein